MGAGVPEPPQGQGFKLYIDSTRIEWIPVNADQRENYRQAPLTEEMPIPK